MGHNHIVRLPEPISHNDFSAFSVLLLSASDMQSSIRSSWVFLIVLLKTCFNSLASFFPSYILLVCENHALISPESIIFEMNLIYQH